MNTRKMRQEKVQTDDSNPILLSTMEGTLERTHDYEESSKNIQKATCSQFPVACLSRLLFVWSSFDFFRNLSIANWGRKAELFSSSACGGRGRKEWGVRKTADLTDERQSASRGSGVNTTNLQH